MTNSYDLSGARSNGRRCYWWTWQLATEYFQNGYISPKMEIIIFKEFSKWSWSRFIIASIVCIFLNEKSKRWEVFTNTKPRKKLNIVHQKHLRNSLKTVKNGSLKTDLNAKTFNKYGNLKSVWSYSLIKTSRVLKNFQARDGNFFTFLWVICQEQFNHKNSGKQFHFYSFTSTRWTKKNGTHKNFVL